VKFRDDVDLPYDSSVEQQLAHGHGGEWRRIQARFAGTTIRPLTRSLSGSRIRELARRGERLDKTYRAPNLLTYFRVDAPANLDADALVRDLASWPLVQRAYVDKPVDDPHGGLDDPIAIDKNYTDEAPHGIDAKYAWDIPGGDGAGQHFIDLEQGWTLDHKGLVDHNATKIFGVNIDTSRPHGTSVLGIVCARYGRRARRGIVPSLASVKVASHSGDIETTSSVIDAAITELEQTGGVLLIEVQRDNLPIELADADFERIRLATANGIVVVAAAGNGGRDLDTVGGAGGDLVLNRTDASYIDSGSILVAGATWEDPHEKTGTTNFGSRIDCFGWGENVRTISSTPAAPFSITRYEDAFGGTSSAAPIIAGAALAILGLATAQGTKLSPFQVRSILTDPGLSTASKAGLLVDKIGVMPDLRKIIDSTVLTNPPPDQQNLPPPHR
jgi:hypothetical protein